MFENKLNRCIRVAFPVSQEIQRSKKHVSLIVRKNEIVSVGTNKFRTHPMAKKFGYRFEEVHSELDALLRYRGPKDNLTLVNFRYNRFGDMRISKPCSKCLPWCVSLFDNIWHSTNEGMQRLNIEDYNV